MKTFVTALVILSAMLCLGTAYAAPALRVAVDAPYPPFAFYNEKGELEGFDVEIGRALCAEMKMDCVIEAVPFDSIIPKVEDGSIDMGIAGMGATEERKKHVIFTDRYFRSHSIFMEKHGTIPDVTVDNLKGKRLGAQAGTIQETYLRNTYGNIASIVTYATAPEAFAALKKGEVDLLFADGLSGYTWLKTDEGEGFETIGEPVHSDIVLDSSCIAVNKDNVKLRDALNEAIQAIRRSGEYDRVNRKYFDFNVY